VSSRKRKNTQEEPRRNQRRKATSRDFCEIYREENDNFEVDSELEVDEDDEDNDVRSSPRSGGKKRKNNEQDKNDNQKKKTTTPPPQTPAQKKKRTTPPPPQTPQKKKKTPPQEKKEIPIDLVDFEKWLLESCSADNTRSVMRQVRLLVRGEGITYIHWAEGVVFRENEPVTLDCDLDAIRADARRYESVYGKDKSHGWLLNHPITKLINYKARPLPPPEF